MTLEVEKKETETYKPKLYIQVQNIMLICLILFVLCAIGSVIIGINTQSYVPKQNIWLWNVIIILILGCTVLAPVSYLACLCALVIIWLNKKKLTSTNRK